MSTQHILATLELAKRMRATDTAALILAANHVAIGLRQLAVQLNETAGPRFPLIAEHAAHLDALAAQLHAALISRPEVQYLEAFAERLAEEHARRTPPANGTGPKGGA